MDLKSENKLNLKTNSSDSPEKKMRLEDLNDDCKFEIYKYLDVNDLVNLIEYDSQFLISAMEYFRLKRSDEYLVTNQFNPRIENESISVKALKYFGGLLKKLIVHYSEKYRRYDKDIDNAIIVNCKQTLFELHFKNADCLAMNEITEPFRHVRTVQFKGGSFCELVNRFDQYFPNAETLTFTSVPFEKDSDEVSDEDDDDTDESEENDDDGEEDQGEDEDNDIDVLGRSLFFLVSFLILISTYLNDITCFLAAAAAEVEFLQAVDDLLDSDSESDDSESDDSDIEENDFEADGYDIKIVNSFPALKHLTLNNIDGDFSIIYNEFIKKLFELNTQLKSVNLNCVECCDDLDGDANEFYGATLELAAATLPQLNKLHIAFPHNTTHIGLKSSTLHFGELTDLSVNFKKCDLFVLPISAPKLEILNLSSRLLVWQSIEFVKSNKTEKILKLNGRWASKDTMSDMIAVIVSLPNLIELEFPYSDFFLSRDLINLLTDCKLLKKLIIVSSSDANVVKKIYNMFTKSPKTKEWSQTNSVAQEKYHRFIFEKNVKSEML